jgi:hypothetical protein
MEFDVIFIVLERNTMCLGDFNPFGEEGVLILKFGVGCT